MTSVELTAQVSNGNFLVQDNKGNKLTTEQGQVSIKCDGKPQAIEVAAIEREISNNTSFTTNPALDAVRGIIEEVGGNMASSIKSGVFNVKLEDGVQSPLANMCVVAKEKGFIRDRQ